MLDNEGIPIDLAAPTNVARPLKTGHPVLDRVFEQNARRAGGFDPEALKQHEKERTKHLR